MSAVNNEASSGSSNPTISLTDSAVFSRIDGESGVVLELDRKRYYVLNETAAYIVEYLQRHKQASTSRLTQAMVETYDVDQDSCAADIAECLNDLAKRNVIESTAPTT